MSLPQYSERARWAAGLLFLVTLAAGCASGPRQPGRSAEDGAATAVPEDAVARFEAAVSAMTSGDSIDAELRFQEFLLAYPGYPGAYVNLAILFAERGDFLAAEASLQEALAIDPAHAVALNRLGMVLREQGRFAEAEDAYMKAITASPDYALAHYNLGVLNDLYLGRPAAALENYERYQELAGEDEQVAKWIADLKRRVDAGQRTANVTE